MPYVCASWINAPQFLVLDGQNQFIFDPCFESRQCRNLQQQNYEHQMPGHYDPQSNGVPAEQANQAMKNAALPDDRASNDQASFDSVAANC